MRHRVGVMIVGLSLVGVARALGADGSAGAGTSVLEQLTPVGSVLHRKTGDGLEVTGSGEMVTSQAFKAPLVITAVVSATDRTPVRFSFGDKGWLVLNNAIANGQKTLLFHDPATGHPIAFYPNGDFPTDQMATVRWTIGKTQTRVEVDGVTRCVIPGDYGDLSGTIGMGGRIHNHIITVHSLTVQTENVKEPSDGIPGGPLQILEAHWGLNVHQLDVTSILREMVSGGELATSATDDVFKTTAGNEGFELGATYLLRGEWGYATFPQGSKVHLGGANSKAVFPETQSAKWPLPQQTGAPQAARGAAAGAVANSPEPPIDGKVIEQPAYQQRAKRLVKNLSSINGLAVHILADGTEIGETTNLIAVVPGDSRQSNESKAVFVREGEGKEMQTSFDEAIRAVKMRYPRWENGRIEVSFDDKYTQKDGGSGGTAFGVLMLSMLEGFDIDPAFAMTGDITVDWKVREVGGVPAKIMGATTGKCHYVAIPESNAADVGDLRLLSGNAALWNIQIFSVATMQDAVALARTDRAAAITEAMKTFADIEPQLAKSGMSALRSPEVRKALAHVLELAPNHLSASYLLKVANGTASSTLSAGSTRDQIQMIRYPYLKILNGNGKIDRVSLPAVVSASSRKKIFQLREICDKKYASFLEEYRRYVDFMDDMATGHATVTELKARTEAIASEFAAMATE